MSQRRRAAEVAEKKAADAIRADDVIEEVIPEARSLNSAPLQSSNGKPSLAGAAAKAKLGGTKPKANKDTEVKQLEEKADEEEKEKTMKFDKNKKVCNEVCAGNITFSNSMFHIITGIRWWETWRSQYPW